MTDALDQAGKEATRLRHGWVGPEHLVLALLSQPSGAGEALRACGLDHDRYRQALEAGPRHADPRPVEQLEGGAQVVTPQAQEVLARAEGIAVGQGVPIPTAEHVLQSLIWTRTSLLALTLLERLGASRERILAELERRGAGLGVPLPKWPTWGEWLPVSSAEFERLAPKLRREGSLYRYGRRAGAVLISIAEPPRENARR